VPRPTAPAGLPHGEQCQTGVGGGDDRDHARADSIVAQGRYAGREDDEYEGYAEAADRLAEADPKNVEGLTDVDELPEKAVVGTVLGDSLPASLRRLAQASNSRGRREP